ncbi:MAG: 3-hydroxyacyl-CoA dehydrogenase NAD-binding domain-containing protein [Chloroflexi bacterium]|nr:3-hydroxyacyl-CoA dehydrogenase NAD-binding domain-containing protein [Chloroflexota bacterium]
MNIKQVAVIGTGMMGPGIAAVVALAGYKVMLVGERPDWVDDGLDKARALMDQLFQHNLASGTAVASAKLGLGGTDDLDAGVRNAELVVEAIYENLEAKQNLFERLDRVTPLDTLLATNTSGLSVTAISERAKHRERIVTTHFWMPPHLVPLVEVVMSPHTSERTAQALLDFLRSCGKQPVLVRKDLPGQLANRILQAMIREATSLVQDGVASSEDVDSAIKNGLGIRLPVWGILEHIDAVGLDLALAVQDSVLPALNNEPHAVQLFADKVKQGDLGVKSGKGYYDWTRRDIDALKQLRDEFIIQTLQFKASHP